MKKVIPAFFLVIAFGILLRVFQLTADLPFQALGATGVFLFDEAAYQLGAVHKAIFGSWWLPGSVYADWTIRGYQIWQNIFFQLFGTNFFSARLGSIAAFMLAQLVLMIAVFRYVSFGTTLIFGLLMSTNFLMVMYSKMASPYIAVLLPLSLVFFFSLEAVFKKNNFYAGLAGFFTFIAVTFKENAIFFVPVVLLFWGIAFRHNRKVLVGFVSLYLLCFSVFYGTYYSLHLAPFVNEFWNTSAAQSSGVASQTIELLTNLSLKTAHKNYTLGEAVSKLFLKFFGMKQIYFTWVLAFIGLGCAVFQRKKLFSEHDSKSLTLLQMLLWAVIVPACFILFRFRSLVAHWIPIYLIPVLFFAAYGVNELWQQKKRWLTATLLVLTLTVDGVQYAWWVYDSHTENFLERASSRLATIIEQEGNPSVIFIDCFFPFLRMPQNKAVYLRSFQQEHFREIEYYWKPKLLVLIEKKDNTQASSSFFAFIHAGGYRLQLLDEIPLGIFDGSDMVLKTFALKKRPPLS